MFVKSNFFKLKIRGFFYKLFNIIENNGNSNFDKNGEKVFIDLLLTSLLNRGGRRR